MKTARFFQRFVDGIVGIFDPARAVRRRRFRRLQARKYDAANDYATSRPWPNVSSSTANEEIFSSWTEVTNRVRMLDRDSGLMRRAVRVHIDHTVNTGLSLEMRLKKPNGDLDKELNDQIEKDFRKFSKQIDVSGRLHFQDIERLAERQICHAGGCLFVKVYSEKSGLLVPFQIQAYELDWLDSSRDSFQSRDSSFAINNGIKYDIVTGKIISFFLRPQYDAYNFDSVEIPASSVIYYMRPERFGQLLPISDFTPALQIGNDFDGYLGSEMDRAYAAAQTAAVVEIEQDGYGNTKATDQKINMEGLAIEYLDPGQSMKFNNTPNVGGSFQPFVKTAYEIHAQGTNTPIEKLSMNYEGLNYSVARNSNNEFNFSKDPDFDLHVRFFADPIVEEFFRIGALSGMNLPGYFEDPGRYMEAVFWRRPKQPALDPVKDSTSAKNNLLNGLDSPQNIMRNNGLDPDKILMELEEIQKAYAKIGITLAWGQTSTAMSSSPSKLEKDSEKSTNAIPIKRSA